MAAPKTPANTAPAPTENPELIGLRESESVLVAKTERLEAMDANEQARGGVDLQVVKQNNARALADVRKRIERLSK